MTQYQFILYVTGETPRSQHAASNLQQICSRYLGSNGAFDIELIDVLDDPERAEDDRIIATPTVIRTWPTPRRRVIGDLSSSREVALALDMPIEQLGGSGPTDRPGPEGQ